jgi:hypothetical protein
MTLLGQAAMIAGDRAAAVHLRRAVEFGPDNAHARELLQQLSQA